MNRLPLYGDFGDFSPFHCGKEITKYDLRLFGLLTIEQIKQEKDHESQHQP
jgi:hypothetical protein